MNRRAQGASAEDQAANHLLKLGYTLVTRRFATRHGEIDLVAIQQTPDEDTATLVFVEVRSRSNPALTPEESVTPRKAANFQAAVAEFFAKTGQPEIPARYDLIAITPQGITHHQAAIQPD